MEDNFVGEMILGLRFEIEYELMGTCGREHFRQRLLGLQCQDLGSEYEARFSCPTGRFTMSPSHRSSYQFQNF